ncbi:endonuclease/exonuclease/phosphatase family protein [Aureispira anguillae]|uniref:Endonuclease/exonuclease/phosphatase family protein n=1 Tax=Aureispira anguillae TaxID=2864201 RepID=A0A915YBF3_9BACT|nr:endonuclease/exonuclease/phosphatase family protein [Aureispira anguillae]BDS09991.1 endonuclease/exonuclease/phosphatase family protein [Aureispira anguillae]
MKNRSLLVIALFLLVTYVISAQEQPKALKVVCYNTHLFGGTIPAWFGKTFYLDNKRLKIIAERLKASNADVIGLSEVWATKNKCRLAKVLGEEYRYQFIDKRYSGLVLYSKYPIENKEFIPFTNLCKADKLSKKGFLSCRIIVPNQGAVHLIMTHLQADYDKDYYQTKEARTANLWQIRRKIAAICDSIPVICMGDFNVIGEYVETEYETEEYRAMKEAFEAVHLVDAFRSLHPKEAGYTYSKENCLIKRFYAKEANSQWRLDYIFCSGVHHLSPLEVKVLRDYQFPKEEQAKLPKKYTCFELSDHYPLMATFKFK